MDPTQSFPLQFWNSYCYCWINSSAISYGQNFYNEVILWGIVFLEVWNKLPTNKQTNIDSWWNLPWLNKYTTKNNWTTTLKQLKYWGYCLCISAQKQTVTCQFFAQKNHCLKSVHIWSVSGPYFPSVRLKTDRYSVTLHIQSE